MYYDEVNMGEKTAHPDILCKGKTLNTGLNGTGRAGMRAGVTMVRDKEFKIAIRVYTGLRCAWKRALRRV